MVSITLKRTRESGTPVVQVWGSLGGEVYSTAFARTTASAEVTMSTFEMIPLTEQVWPGGGNSTAPRISQSTLVFRGGIVTLLRQFSLISRLLSTAMNFPSASRTPS